MPTGAELLRTLQKQQHRAPSVLAPAAEDEWFESADGRRERRRATGEAGVQAASSSSSSAANDDEAGWSIVRQHASEFACWIVIGGRVLDATAYLGHHPGGGTIIRKLAGRDATREYEKARHSRAADLKLRDYDIGALGDLKRLERAASAARVYAKRLELAAAEYL